MKKKAIIFGLKGTKLTKNEKSFLKKEKPWGIILFSRNIKNIYQLKLLVQNIKKSVSDNKYPILIDQEGGRVSRLNKILDFSLYSQKYFGDIYKKDNKNFEHRYKIYIDRVSEILKKTGININTAPVLDVYRSGSHKIIGNRAYSEDPNVVKNIGNICIKLFEKNKIATVIKHIPGHGLSKTDSHFDLPVVKSKKKDLIKNDFFPFKNSNSQFSMTAHIIYSSYDPLNSATHSKVIIKNIIRKHMGYKGIIISDDISMKALKFDLKNNAIKALRAGCNLILHCNGNLNEMKKLAKIIPTIDKFTQKKTSQFYKFLR